MPLTINILRPDDLVVLSIELHNLRLNTTDPKKPELVLDRQGRPAFLVVYFQPQSIAEKAYFETDPNNPHYPKFDKTPPPPKIGTSSTKLPAPGNTPARMSDSSRLVFRLPPSVTQIPYQMEALLDWSKLQLVVSPIAAVPDDGSAHPGLTIAAPTPLETALELPYRVIMSPPGDVGWVNATSPVTHAGRTELWHTRIARLVPSPRKPDKKIALAPTVRNPVPLRAIWSPDFVDHGLLPSHTLDEVPFLTSMSPRDRDQVVILTSGFDGYYMVDPKTNLQVPFVPTPVHATLLFLSSLGGWWDWRGDWSPLPYYYLTGGAGSASGVFRPPRVLARSQLTTSLSGRPLVPVRTDSVQALDLTEWVHVATGARDQYVRIVYEGYLYPFGHKASLVKVSERKVAGSGEAPGDSPVAYLRQRMYIVVREPEKFYAGEPYTYQGREMPLLNHVKINTRVTPSIDQPDYKNSTASFWILVDKNPFPFHISGVDVGGTQCNFLASLIFVADSETKLSVVPPWYTGNDAWRVCPVHATNISYADPLAGQTALKTTALYFDSQIINPNPPFPEAPFLPTLDANTAALVTVPALAALLGSTVPIPIKLYPGYLEHGMDPNAGVFADLVQTVPVKFPANKSGGFGTPDLTLQALSARKGLVGGSPDDAAAGLMDPAAFFDEKGARIFGTIPVKDLIPVNSQNKANAALNSPEIRVRSLPNRRDPKTEITRLNWQPQLKNYARGPVRIFFNAGGRKSILELHARMTRSLDGSPPQSVIRGKLTDFRLSLLGVVTLKFRHFRYISQNGSKSLVIVKLFENNAVTFKGPLSFVQTLAHVLPPGVFGGKGPAIDLMPKHLRISYSLGLPPLSIGVFSLQNIRIMTALALPYLNGKPAFEFGFASRKAPFLLTVECLGGGGFVHVVLDANGVRMVEGALEFGGEFSIDLGVASGAVHALAGIYFQLKAHFTDLTGFVDIGGEVSVLGIISISIDLNLSLSYIASGSGSKVQGRATLTVSVHVLFFGISVSVSVERSFGSGPGDPTVDQMLTAHDWALYASAFA